MGKYTKLFRSRAVQELNRNRNIYDKCMYRLQMAIGLELSRVRESVSLGEWLAIINHLGIDREEAEQQILQAEEYREFHKKRQLNELINELQGEFLSIYP